MPKVTTNASAVFDAILEKNIRWRDADICRAIDVAPSMVSAMRAKRIPFGRAITAKIIDKKLLSARRIKELVES